MATASSASFYVQLGTVKLSRWRHWLNFIKTNGAAPRAAKSAQQRSRQNWQLHHCFEKFWVAVGERSKLDELARAVMLGRFLIAIAFAIFSFQFFLCFIGGVEKHQYRGTSPVCRRHVFNTVFVQLPAASIPLLIRRLIDSQNGLSPCTPLNAHSTLANSQVSTPASSNILMTPRRSSLLSPRPTAAIPSTSIFEERTTTEGKWKKRKTRTRKRVLLSWLTAAIACQLSMVSFLHLILTIAWAITTSRWARISVESWTIRKKKAIVNHASAVQSSRAGSSCSGPTPQSLGVCAAFFCDQARSNWHLLTSATQFHCPKLYIGFDVRLAKSFIRSGNFFFQSKLCPRSIWYGVWISDQKLRRAKKTQGESIAICHCHQYIDTPTAHPLHIFFYQAQLAFHHQSSWCLSLAFSAFFLLSTVW